MGRPRKIDKTKKPSADPNIENNTNDGTQNDNNTSNAGQNNSNENHREIARTNDDSIHLDSTETTSEPTNSVSSNLNFVPVPFGTFNPAMSRNLSGNMIKVVEKILKKENEDELDSKNLTWDQQVGELLTPRTKDLHKDESISNLEKEKEREKFPQ
ncbi:GATA zinc finger domain-containing protein 4-like [Leptopilina heterotoma]|uniref:GATA zinc finger domain-containing protein 4-like n=1 Tax=Leptopilina heterotoma TaxID=63436 RepID=UPI001CA9885C|nr:GATA zinc finger domain-containing protein 4-like [Leptopilina heterotoma]